MKRFLSTLLAAVLVLNLILPMSAYAAEGTPASGTAEITEPDESGVVRTIDFDTGDNSIWTGESSFPAGGRTGSAMEIAKNTAAQTTITGIPQGSYTVTMWVKASTGSGRLTVSDTGGPDSVVKMKASSDWMQLAHRNVLVYNGQMTLAITPGSASAPLLVDDIQITLDSNDNNPVTNWNFEDGLTGWEQKGTAVIDSSSDTGSKAVKLSDQSEISQTISVKPDTDYIASVRMKVDVEDTYKSTPQYAYQSDSSVMGVFVERTSLGNRVNLGVRGADGGAVLRQAPSSTAGYSLVTVAFHTGESQTEVELYANTIFDQAYRDSVTVYENTYGDEDRFLAGYQRPNPNSIDQTHLADSWQSNGSSFAYVDNFDVFEVDNTYIKGADMSFMQVIEDCGGKYFANGVQQDALRILSNHGVNSILTMLFVHSGNEIYDWSDLEWMEPISKDYDGNSVSFRKQVEGYFDVTHSTKIALRAQELGMTYLPSFHYSDTWISAAKAHMPYEWFEQDYEGKLSNGSIEMLTTAVYNYVYEALSDMKKNGVDNIIGVKSGNEQDGGLLFPVASGLSSVNHAAVISASVAAVHDVYPGAINMTHSNGGDNVGKLSSFFNVTLNNGAVYDAMSFSLYGGHPTTDQYSMMLGALADSRLKRFDYINVETAMSMTSYSPVDGNGFNSSGSMLLKEHYDNSPTGQYNYLLNYMQAPLDIPNPYGVIRGFYFWNAEAIAVFGAGHKVGISVDGSKRTLFNNGDVNIKEMGSSQPGKMGDMSAGVYAYLHRGHTKAPSSSVYTPLQDSRVNYAKGAVTEVAVENSSMNLAVGERERLKLTIAPVDQVLEDYRVEYTSSNPGVAEVSPYGFVVGKSAGSAVITATVGSVSAEASVTVRDVAAANGITVNYSIVRGGETIASGTAEANGTITGVRPYDKVKFTTALTGTPTDTAVIYTKADANGIAKWFGDTWQTDDGTMRSVTQAISKNNIQSVVQLNPVKDGTVSVTAASADGNTSITFQVQISATAVTGVEIQGNSTVQAGKTRQLSAKITPEDATLYKVTWSSSDTAVATVDETGLVTGVKPGTATITAASEAYPDVKGILELTVTDVQVSELFLSRKTLHLVQGTKAALTATAVPDNAVNKDITWSVADGSIASVDQNGNVTANAVGTTTITAKNALSGVSAECTVTVQAAAVDAVGMHLSEKAVWVKSNYFSPDAAGKGDNKPAHKLEAVLEPEDATYTGITWESSSPNTASVDQNGVITAHAPGMATITAKLNGGTILASATVYVPSVSEDWENYDEGAAGGFTDGNTFTYQVVKGSGGNQELQASISGKGSDTTLSRYQFAPVGGSRVVAEFDWDTGTFKADNRLRGAHISIEDANRNTWLALASFPVNGSTVSEMVYYWNKENNSTAFPAAKGTPNGNFNYIHGGSGSAAGTYADCVDVGTGLLTGQNQEYHVRLELDFENRKISFTVTSKDDPTKTSTVSNLPMDPNISYTDTVGAITFSHYFNSAATWTTSIDNLAVYSADVAVEDIAYTVDCASLDGQKNIRLIPVTGAVSAEARISAAVLPAEAGQGIAYTVSSELADWINVADDGRITIKENKLVSRENFNQIGDAVSGTVRAASVQNPAVYKDIKVTIGPRNAVEKQEILINGTPSDEFTQQLATGAPVKLSFSATGGDGDSVVYSYKWEVTSGSAVIDYDVLTAVRAGTVTVRLTLDLFGDPIVKTTDLTFTGEDAPMAQITIKFQDEEGNTIRDSITKTENYTEGQSYTVPESLQSDFRVKDSMGKTTLYKFNASVSELTKPYAQMMELVLRFNNVGQYDYYEDFENYTITGWHEQEASVPDPTIETDHTNYLKHTTGSGTTGGYITFDQVDAAGKKVRITSDVKFTKPAGSKPGNSQFTISSAEPKFSGGNITWGIYDTGKKTRFDGHIIGLEYNTANTLLVNGETANAAFIGDWMHMEAEADFTNKKVKITLTNDSGLTQTFETAFYSTNVDSNIGSFYLRSAGSGGTVSADNLTVTVTGDAAQGEPNIKSDLNYKSIYAFGDSIVYGHNTPAESFMRLLTNDYAMDLSMMAKNGATVMPSDNDILTQVNAAPGGAPDFIVFDGYTNDAYGPAESDSFNSNGTNRDITACYGEMKGPGTSAFDTATFCGAFEQTLYAMKQKWPDSRIVFVTIHKSGGRNFEIQQKLHDLTVEMCKAWDVAVVDMFRDTTLDTRDASQMAKYIIGGKGSHPNVTCCREFYIPQIVEKLESLLKGGTEEPDACKHTALQHTEAVPAACTKDGNMEYWYCSDCRKYFSDEQCRQETTLAATVIESAGHTLTHYPPTAPTETTNGNIEYWYCAKCGKYFSDEAGTSEIDAGEIELPATGPVSCAHENQKETATQEAACTTPGSVTMTCLDCGEVVSVREVPALGHAAEFHERTEPTDTEEGNIAYWHCGRCEKNFRDEACTEQILDVTIPVPGSQTCTHENTEEIVNQEAACTVPGSITVRCTDCQKELTIRGIPALGHSAERRDAAAPTETEDGHIEHWYCGRCGKYFRDADCTVEIMDVTIPATGPALCKHPGLRHTAARPASCTESGNTEYWYCSDCGKYFSSEAADREISSNSVIIPASGHGQASVSRTEPTCTKDGRSTTVCADCGAVLSTQEIPALGHDTVYVPQVNATYSAEGNIAHWYCGRCGGYFLDADCTDQISKAETVIPQRTDNRPNEARPSRPAPSKDPETATPSKPSEPAPIQNPDGSVTIVDTKSDGTVTTTRTSADGVEAVTTVRPDGEISAEVFLPETVQKAVVTLPVNSETAEIPLGISIVAVDARTGEIIKLSMVDETGITVALTESVQIKLLDNTKRFDDVKPDAWYHDAVAFAASRELMNGTGHGEFAPNEPLTRGMIAQILYNLEGPVGAVSTNSFTDVPEEAWYHETVSWAAECGVVTGYGNGVFSPDSPITREQMAVILYRYARQKSVALDHADDLSAFQDGDAVSGYAQEAMRWAVQTGILDGKDGGRLDPGGHATRGEIAAIFMRFSQTLMA